MSWTRGICRGRSQTRDCRLEDAGLHQSRRSIITNMHNRSQSTLGNTCTCDRRSFNDDQPR